MTKRNAIAVNVPHFSDLDKAVPGQFIFTGLHATEGGPYGILFVCPCGCGSFGSVHFNVPSDWAEKHNGGKPLTQWTWNGNKEKPTLSPSILHENHWHGYLRDGVFEEC
jgi:hypothetical protein